MNPKQNQEAGQPSPQVSARSTKAEIFDAYKELVKQYKQNVQEISAKQKQSERMKKEKVVEKTAQYTVEDVTKNLDELKGRMSSALHGLADKLTDKVETLSEIQKAIEIEKKNLEEVHKIKIESNILVNIIKAQEEAKKQAQREEEEERISKSLERKREQVKHQMEVEDKRREFNKEIEERREKIEERELVLKEREQELEDLRAKADNFPKHLEEEIKKARDKGCKQASREAEIKASLLAGKVTGDKQIAELKISSLGRTAAEQKQEIEALKKQLERAVLKNQELASTVIEGASGAKFFKLNEKLKEGAEKEEKEEQ